MKRREGLKSSRVKGELFIKNGLDENTILIEATKAITRRTLWKRLRSRLKRGLLGLKTE